MREDLVFQMEDRTVQGLFGCHLMKFFNIVGRKHIYLTFSFLQICIRMDLIGQDENKVSLLHKKISSVYCCHEFSALQPEKFIASVKMGKMAEFPDMV